MEPQISTSELLASLTMAIILNEYEAQPLAETLLNRLIKNDVMPRGQALDDFEDATGFAIDDREDLIYALKEMISDGEPYRRFATAKGWGTPPD